MVNFLARIFIKNRDNVGDPAVRRAWGSLISALGIALNILLSAAKLLAGSLVGSISICADALNNLSDAGSSLISLISFKLSAKPADREHPFGHARIEYIASMIVSFLVLFVGIELVRGSVEKLLAPIANEFSIVTVVILSLSVLVKLWMALFNHSVGKRIQSDVMRATATDCLSDAAATSAVLLATLLSRVLPEAVAVYIDPVMGLLVAVLIFVAGLRILNETKNHLLGEAPDDEIVALIRNVVAEYPDAIGIHDMVVHTYGPGRTIASLHVEVDGKNDIFASHDTIDLIEKRLREVHGIECTIHLDPVAVGDPTTDAWLARVRAAACRVSCEIRVHDFRMVPGASHTNLLFDLEVPFEIKTDDACIKRLVAEYVAEEAPNYFCVITVDRV